MKIYSQLLTVITGFSLTLVQPYAVVATSADVSRVATGITVKIESQNAGSSGSGVLISRRGNTYSVLTCWHVADSNSPLVVTTPDGQRYIVQSRSIKRVNSTLDLAIVEFTSNKNYNLAKVGNSEKIQAGESAYIAGFPHRSDARQDSLLLFNEGKINANNPSALKNGYALIYNINTLPGMSGGPILDDQGSLIGIHGRGDRADDVTVLLQSSQVNPGVVVKSGFNYGIPIHTFRKYAISMNISLAEASTIVSSPTQERVPRKKQTASSSKVPLDPTIEDPFTMFRKAKAAREQLVPSKTVDTLFTPKQLFNERHDNTIAFNQNYDRALLRVKGKVTNIFDAKGNLFKASFIIWEIRDQPMDHLYTVTCEVDNPNDIVNLR
jgi:Trypsin-like peptidase domain